MPPKKRQPKAQVEPEATTEIDDPLEKAEAAKEQNAGDQSTAADGAITDEKTMDEAIEDGAPPQSKPTNGAKSSKKRKQTAHSDEPQKAPRRSGRGAPKTQASQQQLLNYMLSKDAEELCQPEDETNDVKSRGNIRTYSTSLLNPFEELLCAVILSRPISHRLGLRSIRTVLNDPYAFTSARAIVEAGKEKQHQALWDAKTQHKAKTAEQIGQIAEVVLDKFTASGDKEGTQLQKVREESDKDVDEARDMLKENVKGLGKTGLDIFFRRVQWLWEAAFPFVDDRTRQSLKKIGLPDDGEDLQKLLNEHWSELDTKHVAGGNDAAKKRRAFVVILERATGSDLEGKTDALIEAAVAT